MQTGTAIEAHIDGLSREDANGLQGLLTAKREEAMERVKKGPKKEQKL
jgi:hypothetical protein